MNDSVLKSYTLTLVPFAVTFAEFQIIQDEPPLPLYSMVVSTAFFRIIYIFHLITVAQFHTADADGTFLFLGDLIDGEAQEKPAFVCNTIFR